MYFGGISHRGSGVVRQALRRFLDVAGDGRSNRSNDAGYVRSSRCVWKKNRFRFSKPRHRARNGSRSRSAAERLISKLDPAKGQEIKNRSMDSQSAGVQRQDALRAQSNDLYIEEHLWSGIGLARSGCGSAIVGDPDQVLAKLNRYTDMGIRAFILSGYPHLDECDLFAKYVLPKLKTTRLNEAQGRLVQNPVTPLTSAIRV